MQHSRTPPKILTPNVRGANETNVLSYYNSCNKLISKTKIKENVNVVYVAWIITQQNLHFIPERYLRPRSRLFRDDVIIIIVHKRSFKHV